MFQFGIPYTYLNASIVRKFDPLLPNQAVTKKQPNNISLRGAIK